MIEANEKLFEPILEKIKVDTSREYPFHELHCMVFSKDEEKVFFQNISEIDVQELFYGVYASLLMCDESYYLVVNNRTIDIYNAHENDFIEICEEYDSSFFLYLSLKGRISFKEDKLISIYDNLLYKEDEIYTDFEYFSSNQKKIRKHSFEKLKGYFEDFKIFKILDDDFFLNHNGKLDIFNLLSFLLIEKNSMGRVPFEEQSLSKFYDISIEKNPYIPYEFIMESLLAIRWKHIFKDLYRCIEALYAFPKAQKFIEDIEYPNIMEIEKVILSLEEKLGWRPTEQQALQELLTFLDEKSIENFLIVYPYDGDKKVEYIAKKIYRLRNSLVHYRKALYSEENNLSDEQWNQLIRSMLIFIQKIYKEMYRE